LSPGCAHQRAKRHDRVGFLKRHPGEGRDLAGAVRRQGEIPAFAGMTRKMKRLSLKEDHPPVTL